MKRFKATDEEVEDWQLDNESSIEKKPKKGFGDEYDDLRSRCGRLSGGKQLNKYQTQCQEHRLFCSDLKIGMGHGSRVSAQYPLLTITEWRNILSDIPILINSFAFRNNGYKAWYYEMPCTSIIGLGQSSDGQRIGLNDRKLDLDYLVIERDADKQKLKFLLSNEFSIKNLDKKSSAIPGLILIKNGNFLKKHPIYSLKEMFQTLQKTYRCDEKNSRMILGTFNKRRSLFIMTISENEKGGTCREVAEFLEDRGVDDAIFFDGGGSTSLSIKDSTLDYQTENHKDGKLRPIPHVLGIKPASSYRFF
jgi:hypothetical protein